MRRLALSLVFGVLMAVSIVIKVQGDVAGSVDAMYPDDSAITDLLEKEGFQIDRAAPNTDPEWVYGIRRNCRVQIASVSPQGWHRSVVEWQARNQTLLYSAGGALHDRQPILGPLTVHYLNRLKRYLGFAAPAVPIRAIIMAPECAADALPRDELAALSF